MQSLSAVMLVVLAKADRLSLSTPQHAWFALVGLAMVTARVVILRVRNGPDSYPAELPVHILFCGVSVVLTIIAIISQNPVMVYIAIFAVWIAPGGLAIGEGWGPKPSVEAAESDLQG